MADEPPDLIRMEYDRSLDWNLEEYSFQDNSGNEVNRALEKSCSLGKKILVTGFMLSSAPVVLPPFFVISVFGFVVSIPYVVFLASYASTEMIMSMLLPFPIPPLLEYDLETREAAYLDEEFSDFKDHIEQNYAQVSEEDEEKEFEDEEKIVEDNGYEETIDEYVECEPMIGKQMQKNDELLDSLDVDVIVIQGDENKVEIDDESREIPIEVTTVVLEENGGRERVGEIINEEESLKETMDLLVKVRDEGKAEDNMANENQYQEELFGGNDVQLEGNGIEVIQKLEMVIEDVEPIREMGNSVDTVGVVPSENPIHDVGKEDNGRIENIDIFQSDAKKRMLVNFHEDGREIADDSEFDSLDKANSAAQYPRADLEASEGFSDSKDDVTVDFTELSISRKPATKSDEAELSSVVVIDVTESADISVSAIIVESNVEAYAPGNGHMVPSNEELYKEKNIREQIDAVKKILGYKAEEHEKCTEELVALYTFVGVEASSLIELSDLNEVNEKLQFLMSIVGVK